VLCRTLRDVSPPDYSDETLLVKALCDRDVDAFAYLIDRYHASLIRIARMYVPSNEIAEEVVQETWLAVLQGVERFEQRATLKTWLYRVLVNIARARGAKERRTIPYADAEDLDDGPAVDPRRFRRFGRHSGAWKRPPNPWPEPEQTVIDADVLAAVQRAAESLPPAQREVLTLRDVLGWNATEVCDSLGITDANQRVLLHRARSKVRGELERYYGEGGRS
jgi:RNA polymerase sigma-70 factor (ECF subfamily)